MAPAGCALGWRVPWKGSHHPHHISIGRNVFRLLGRIRAATKSLKGRLAVAQPPGATMAVRVDKLARVTLEVKAQARISQRWVGTLLGGRKRRPNDSISID